MPRRPQSPAVRGSQFWTQALVRDYPEVLEAAIDARPITWLSPLQADDYAEYWDAGFVDRLALKLDERPLFSFWPRSGPRWDALGRIRGGAAILLEAKSHIAEMTSTCRASPASRHKIERAFDEIGRGWRVSRTPASTDQYYQYANRLAHAYLLNELNAQRSFVVFLHLANDGTMANPVTVDRWRTAIGDVHAALGVRNRLPPYVIDAFIDVSGSRPVAA